MSETLGMIFDEVASLYDAVRPVYPQDLIETVETALRGTQKRILEIGCGTGQATLPFARRGYHITGLEPGKNLAALAARNLAAFPQVNIRQETFEEWPLAEEQFDLIMSATAFHWVSPEIRYAKTSQALTDSGWLALFWNTEDEDDTPLARQIQSVYDTYKPSNRSHPYTTHHPTGGERQRGAKTTRWEEEIERSQLFGQVRATKFRWAEWYSTERYLQLLETYSDHRAMPADDRRRLFDGIARLLDDNGGGRLKPYLV